MDKTSSVVVTVDLRPHDVYTPFRWERNNVARWVSAIVLCWIFYDLYKTSSEALLSFPGGRSIMAVVALLVLFILFALLLFPYLRVRALFRKSPVTTKSTCFTLGPAGINIHSDAANGEYKWPLFQRVIETRHVFAFASTSQSAIYIPKRCFRSPNDVARMREIIRENMPGKWNLRRF
jgi:hypothetical protein